MFNSSNHQQFLGIFDKPNIWKLLHHLLTMISSLINLKTVFFETFHKKLFLQIYLLLVYNARTYIISLYFLYQGVFIVCLFWCYYVINRHGVLQVSPHLCLISSLGLSPTSILHPTFPLTIGNVKTNCRVNKCKYHPNFKHIFTKKAVTQEAFSLFI